MFITVMFGADCRMLVNSWCSLVTFIVHLKQKAQVPPEVTIALLAEDGHLVRLEEGTVPAPSMACSLLQEQGTYVLVRIIKGKDGAPTHYESLLDNLGDQYPELAGEYQDKWGGGTSTQLPATGFPGSSRGAVLALRLARHKPQSEKTHKRSAWPPGTRSPFKVSEGGLPPIYKPLAGAIARMQVHISPAWHTP
ncbi:uncharacterized protein C22orf15 homolog isoform X2 [Microtus ochrogaster]|uniref:Uncharacterized protein C22orf15 homolog isoform X2 n=1 Tax=Microtus ochrogaster TaxID=79684 RepID=A0ABM1UHK9_MICOH|nr:uncharacterized protein C22orf15 homolog isoform X2 [Microtus ochrogaster]